MANGVILMWLLKKKRANQLDAVQDVLVDLEVNVLARFEILFSNC